MKALLTNSRGRLWLQDARAPEIGDYDCLVRMEVCLFCHSTDRHIVEGTFPFGTFHDPSILGHESIGIVEKTGPKVKSLKTGDRVLRAFAIYPDDLQGGFGSAWGGFAEYGKVQDWQSMIRDGLPAAAKPPPIFRYMQQVPADIPLQKALLMITQKEIFSAQRKIGDVAGKSILIAGAGITACLFGLFLRQRGARVTIVARRAEALNRARSLGAADQICRLDDAQRLQQGCDALVEATGSIAAIRSLADQALRPGAPVYCYAIYGDAGRDAFFESLSAARPVARIDPDEPSAHDEVVEMIRQGRLDPAPFISGVHRLMEYQQAWEEVVSGRALKTGIIFGG